MSAEPPIRERSVGARATAALRAVLLRSVLVKALSLVTMLLVARQLGPREFGVAALGLTLVAFGVMLADGGLGAALVRRPEPPSRAELSNLLGWQLAITAVVVVLTAVIAPSFGTEGRVVLLMSLVLPVMVLQTPGVVLLERELRYRPRVAVELVEAVVFSATAVALVLAGAGVWSLAWATVLRGVAGTVAMLAVAPGALPRPRFSPRGAWALMSFGARVQAVGAVNLLRDQGLNVLVAALGGAAALGVWNLAFRVMQVVYTLPEALWRVSFPAMARLIETGADPRAAVTRFAHAAGIANGTLIVAILGGADVLIPWVFGPEWGTAGTVVILACIGVIVLGPVSVAAAGYLYATGRAGVVLAATVAYTLSWLVTVAILWPHLGVTSMGWGWAVSGVVDAVVLGVSLKRWSGVSSLSISGGYVALAAVPVALGAWLSHSIGLPVGSLLGALLFAGLVLALRREECRALWSHAAGAGRHRT